MKQITRENAHVIICPCCEAHIAPPEGYIFQLVNKEKLREYSRKYVAKKTQETGA